MKTLLLSAAAAIALTGPVFANSAEFAIRHFAQSEESGDGALRIGNATSSGDAGYTVMHFAQDREGGDGPRVLIPSADQMVVSTSNSDSATYAAAKLYNDESGDN